MAEPKNIPELFGASGYRPITIRSYSDLIGGCRYVAIETVGSDRFRVVQFTPRSAVATWDITRWEDHSALFIASAKRSELDVHGPIIRSSYEWFGKVSGGVNLTDRYFFGNSDIGYTNRGSFFSTLDDFIENESGGHANLFDVDYAFERAHPADVEQREFVDLARQRAELAAQEERILHLAKFSQVDELRSTGAQHLANGEQALASSYFREADALKGRIQGRIDQGLAIVRENITVQPMWEFVMGGTPTRGSSPAPAKKETPKVSVVKPSRRTIILED